MKDNYHRELHHQLTSGKITSAEYTRKVERHNRQAMRVMIRQNMKSLKTTKETKGKA
jgi:hypothetical protein